MESLCDIFNKSIYSSFHLPALAGPALYPPWIYVSLHGFHLFLFFLNLLRKFPVFLYRLTLIHCAEKIYLISENSVLPENLLSLCTIPNPKININSISSVIALAVLLFKPTPPSLKGVSNLLKNSIFWISLFKRFITAPRNLSICILSKC